MWQALAIGAIGFAGLFCVFSYLAPTMLQVTGVSAAWIPLGLAGFGLGGAIGNFAGGWLFDLPALPRGAGDPARRGGGAAAVPVGDRFAVDDPAGDGGGRPDGRARPGAADAPDGRGRRCADAGRRLHHAAFNAANALGPWLGGMAISAGWGWTSTGYVGAITALLGMAIYAWAAATLRRPRRQACAATT